ncbi:hypothetical protein LINPERHAP2_LOCUS30757 [Linum perenne]
MTWMTNMMFWWLSFRNNGTEDGRFKSIISIERGII